MYKNVSYPYRIALLCFIFCLTTPFYVLAKVVTQPDVVATIQWPYQLSDLEPDPSIVRGVLPNGLRYIIKENHEPENRVAAFLSVFAGSMEETDEQQGVAHFLEHMMFNGSTHFPPGTLIDYFQSIGMDFGGDINAYTGFEKTVYHLILPNGTKDELGIGCQVLADYASGALLLDSEIDRERGVIFSEKRSRDSISHRNHLAYTEFAFKGTRYPLRMPIGKESVLKTANHDLLKEYYDSWYRPDNMVLVLVGDLEVESTQDIIATYFSALKSYPTKRKKPDFGILEHSGLDVFYRYEPELGKTNVSIETLWNVTPKTPTALDEKDEIVKIIGDLIISYRLQQAEENSEQPYAAARYSSGQLARRIGYGSIYAITDEKSWRQTLEELHHKLETARIYGFTEKEVTRARDEIYAELEKNVQTESSLHSRIIAKRIVDHLVDGDVYMSPSQEWDLYTPMLREITVEDINEGFKIIWDNPSRLISVTGNTKLAGEGEDQIINLYNSIAKTKIVKRKVQKEIVFPYLKTYSGSVLIKEKSSYPELGVVRYVLGNGLVINLKKTDFEKNKIRISANFGKGEQAESKPGMAVVAGDVVNLSGTNQLSVSALDSVFAGSSVELSFQIGRASSSWSGSALSGDVDLLAQLLQVMLLDPGFDKIAFNKVMRRLELMSKKLDSEIDGAVLRKVQPFLAGYNRHYGFPSWDQLSAFTFDEMQIWVKKIFAIEDLEISVVGDFDEGNVVGILNTYLGGIKLKKPPARILDETIIFPEGRRLDLNVSSEIQKSTIILTWPTDDFWDISRTRRLSLLSAILEDRIRKIVREKLGASYSPKVSSYGSKIHHNYGYLQVEVGVEKGKEDFLVGELKKLATQVAQGGVTDEELDRAKQPVMTSVLENVKTNQYWLYSVLSISGSHPEQLIWPTTIVDDINSITVGEVSSLAAQYLQNTKVIEAVIRAGVTESVIN
ncbi:MAG: zinc protease [Desulforhopalus sp.]|jgi:zinc protease